MDLKFSEMSVDTTLAQEYLKKYESLLNLYNDYNGTIEKYKHSREDFYKILDLDNELQKKDEQTVFKEIASKLIQNATLIAQLEYHIRNIPIEETHAQLNLLIQYFRSWSSPRPRSSQIICRPDDPLLVFGYAMACTSVNVNVKSKALVAICHLLVTLYYEAGLPVSLKLFKEIEDASTKDTADAPIIYLKQNLPVKGLDSGTVAVVSDDADIDSAVDKFISISKEAPWRLRRILVQESVYQEFKEALNWKCKLNKSGSEAYFILCSYTLTYNDRTFLIDPVELIEEYPSVVIVEAYRTTKEMISLLQQYKARYLSLWINGVAEINEVTHSTMAPIVWVNTVADFRGPPQVSHAVFSNYVPAPSKKLAEVTKLCELSQSWLKLDFESRRDILCSVLDEYILLEPKNQQYTDIKHSISSCTQQSFLYVGKDYVCTGMLQPEGIKKTKNSDFFTAKGFESILQGNAVIVIGESSPYYSVLELKGVPVVNMNKNDINLRDFSSWDSRCFMQTRVIWTNSGTIFAN